AAVRRPRRENPGLEPLPGRGTGPRPVVNRSPGAAPRAGDFSGMCSWESSEPPNLAHRVQILASLLPTGPRSRRVGNALGVGRPAHDFPKVGVQVRLLAGALSASVVDAQRFSKP